MSGPVTKPEALHVVWQRVAPDMLVARLRGAVARVYRLSDGTWSYWIQFPDGTYVLDPRYPDDAQAMEGAVRALLKWEPKR